MIKVRVFKTLVTDIQDVYRDAKKDLTKSIERFDESLRDVGLVAVLTILDRQESFLLRLDGSLTDSVEKRHRVLNWLSPERFNNTYETFQETRVKHSGTWFLKLPKFQRWVKSLSNLFIVTGMGMFPSSFHFKAKPVLGSHT